MKRHILVVLALGLGACADKAKPQYAECVKLEASGKLREAAAACQQSISADPTSASGKAAAEKLKALQPALEKLAKEDADKAAQAVLVRQEQERQAAEAQRQAVAALRSKTQRERTFSAEDDTCASKGKPPRSYRYTGGTYAENESVAYSDGCVAYDDRAVSAMGHAQNHFCCPR
jgi:hypothetical protein